MKKRRILPKEYRFSHEFALFLHDTLAQIVVDGERAGLNLTQFSLKSVEEAKEMEGLQGEKLWEWLDAQGYRDKLYEIAYRETFMALLSDFCQYVFEALRSSQKGKLSVAYTLLRKPFKDNLLMLEWMLVDPKDFIARYFSQGVEHPFIIQKISEVQKRNIIKAATTKASLSFEPLADYFYEIRYDKKCRYGLEPVWQKAAHLVTHFKGVETEPLNFNFIYSDFDAKQTQWKLIYYQVPLLLFHAVAVVESLLREFVPISHEMDLSQLRRIAGFLLWVDSITLSPEARNNLLETAESMRKELGPLSCSKCEASIMFTVPNLRRFYHDGSMRCGQCKAVVQFVQMAVPDAACCELPAEDHLPPTDSTPQCVSHNSQRRPASPSV